VWIGFAWLENFITFRQLFLFLARQTLRGPKPPHSQGFQITHNDKPQSIRLLGASDQLVTETST
jgi:hypothetical protein